MARKRLLEVIIRIARYAERCSLDVMGECVEPSKVLLDQYNQTVVPRTVQNAAASLLTTHVGASP